MYFDGYPDQSGENEPRKYYISNFKELLLKNSTTSMKEQGRALNFEFLDWKGVKEQTDDVLVVGFKPLS